VLCTNYQRAKKRNFILGQQNVVTCHPNPLLRPGIFTDIFLEYEVLPKNSGHLTIKKFLTVIPSFHRLLRSSPLGHVYSDPSVFPRFHASLEVLKYECVDNLLRFCVDLLSSVKTTSVQP